MIRTFVLTAALAFTSAGAAAAQNLHAAHAGMQHWPPAAVGVVTTPTDCAMMPGTPERFSATFVSAAEISKKP